MNIGKTVRRIRMQKGLSKNELCSKTGLNKGYVYRLESDLISPTLITLEKIAAAIDERLSDIIKLAENETALSFYKPDSGEWGHAAEDASFVPPDSKNPD